MGQFGIGQAITRTEDQRFLTGEGTYTDDIDLPGQAHAAVVRSPIAHGRITSIDIEEARAAPGVLDIITGADVKAAGLGTIPNLIPLKNKDGSDIVEPPRPVLPTERVRHVGDPVAFVVAETLAQARDAADLVMVDYDELPAQIDLDDADAADSPRVWDEAPRNTALTWDLGDEAAADAALAEAAHVVELKLVNNRLIVNSMEGRVAIGAYADGKYTLHTGTQGVHGLRRQLAKTIFDVPSEQVRVVTPDVGGGFGMKIFLYPEQPLVMLAAKRIGRPVKWTAERSADGFLSDSHGRDQVSTVKLALDADLNFTGLKVHTKANLGAYLSNFGVFVPTACGSKMMVGVYRTPAIHVEVQGLFTNTVPVDAYRGAGRPEVSYLLERLVDKAAIDLGVDAADLRRRNFIAPEAMPYATPLATTYDSGLFARNMDRALEIADAAGFPERRRKAEAAGKLRGLGTAYYIECCGAGPGERATLRASAAGRVTLFIGTQSNGQGHETAYKQIIADGLGLDIADIDVVQGDTDLIRKGGGTGGSRSIPEGGVAVRDAGDALIEKGKRIAGLLLEAAADDIDYLDGAFTVKGTDRTVPFRDVAAAAHDPDKLPAGEAPGLDGEADHKAAAQTFPNGCHVCEVEIDADTGVVTVVDHTVVDDFGTVLNPLLLAGQVHGGVAQGLGQALLEYTAYDTESGQLLTGSFMDYTMPRADDVPFVDFHYFEDAPCTTNPLGIKGAGEAGAIGAPPAAMNAVVDALRPFGVSHVDMPATREKIWRLIRDGRAAGSKAA
ncbi:xanthine dehydrogenase family protein molybdopterin-binding subunit [Marivibrio halodurans]|uniref:Xanthine dehydrogenase family protein molybdopterin-binding subunit n=1 Tax=Marivibrio halodurans TaxID=2039722 RepID=A0A8J7V1M1_9PROT|nr:xanthine dehydrogenase family protein molybdopterin-binding subunit [Marivibrio halodurans]MBP5855957.1 xanthine dehydrogenase family protein molybdopterin-binding subunit [Marivibrio halodurans]